MSEKGYNILRLIGNEQELNLFCDQHILTSETGKVFFYHDSINTDDILVNDVNLYLSATGKVLLVKILLKIKYCTIYDLVYTLQKEFPELIFFGEICTEWNEESIYFYTRIKNGVICKDENDLNIIDEANGDPFNVKGWWNSDSPTFLMELAHKLDNDVKNIRVLKLKQIEERNSLDQENN